MRRRSGQSTIELCFALVVAILALVAMWPLTRDAIIGRWKAVGDTFSFGLQYEPGVTQCFGATGNPEPC